MRTRIQNIMALAAAGMAALLLAAPAGAAEIEGRWLTGKREVAVTFFPCGEAMCGRIDWLAKPRYRGGEVKRDQHNPDPALRDRPWCGITVITGLRRNGDGDWVDGTFYYPKDGDNYDLEVEPRGEGLRVHAFLGVRFLGKSEDWIRAPADLPGCPDVD